MGERSKNILDSRFHNSSKSNSYKMNSRAQVSMEYLIIFGIAFMMTIPLIVIYAKQTSNVQADITQAQMYKVASKISDYADQVYFMGAPSQRTLTIEFPRGIDSISISGSMLTFNITTSDLSYSVVKEASANMSGTIRPFSGQHIISFKAEGNTVVIADK